MDRCTTTGFSALHAVPSRILYGFRLCTWLAIFFDLALLMRFFFLEFNSPPVNYSPVLTADCITLKGFDITGGNSRTGKEKRLT